MAKYFRMELDVLLSILSQSRPIFRSVDDFKEELARLLEKELAASVEQKRPNNAKLMPHLVVNCPSAGRIAISLQYRTERFKTQYGGEAFALKNHKANDQARYTFWSHVEMLEKLLTDDPRPFVAGYAILLANDPFYWKEGTRPTFDDAFRLTNERDVPEGPMEWDEKAKHGTRKPSEKPIRLRAAYTVRWKDYSEKSGSAFRYLLLKANTPATESVRPRPFGKEYEEENENLPRATAELFAVDPAVVERGIRGHAKTQNSAANCLRSLGLKPLSPDRGDVNFDIAWRVGTQLYVGEVKSITDTNEETQLRLGLGQVLRYAHQLGREGSNVVPVLIAERCPSDSQWAGLCEHLGVILVWPDVFDTRLC